MQTPDNISNSKTGPLTTALRQYLHSIKSVLKRLKSNKMQVGQEVYIIRKEDKFIYLAEVLAVSGLIFKLKYIGAHDEMHLLRFHSEVYPDYFSAKADLINY